MPVGRILSRREVLAVLGFSGAAALLGACQPPGMTPAGAALPTATPGVSAEKTTAVAIGQSPAAQAAIGGHCRGRCR